MDFVRRIDDLGRIVIPKEMRRILKIKEGDSFRIYNCEKKVIVEPYVCHDTEEDCINLMNIIFSMCGKYFPQDSILILKHITKNIGLYINKLDVINEFETVLGTNFDYVHKFNPNHIEELFIEIPKTKSVLEVPLKENLPVNTKDNFCNCGYIVLNVKKDRELNEKEKQNLEILKNSIYSTTQLMSLYNKF